jgi:hypothetical protein
MNQKKSALTKPAKEQKVPVVKAIEPSPPPQKNFNTFNSVKSEPKPGVVQSPSKKRFLNQYNNEKYLAHPETTYTNKLLTLIFEPKQKSVKQQRIKVQEYKDNSSSFQNSSIDPSRSILKKTPLKK